MADRKATGDSFTATTKENPRKDFLSYLLNVRDPQIRKGFEEEELDTDSCLLIAAGADTAGIRLTAAFCLLKNPRVLKKLTDKTREAFADAEEIRGGTKLNSQAYLRTCIDETPRLAPPASTHLQDRSGAYG